MELIINEYLPRTPKYFHIIKLSIIPFTKILEWNVQFGVWFKKEEEPDSLPRAVVERGNYAELLLIRVDLPVNVISGTLGTGHKTRLTPGWGNVSGSFSES